MSLNRLRSGSPDVPSQMRCRSSTLVLRRCRRRRYHRSCRGITAPRWTAFLSFSKTSICNSPPRFLWVRISTASGKFWPAADFGGMWAPAAGLAQSRRCGLGIRRTLWMRTCKVFLSPSKPCAHVCASFRYGSHPIYLEHRYNETTRRSQSHGVFHFGYVFCP